MTLAPFPHARAATAALLAAAAALAGCADMTAPGGDAGTGTGSAATAAGAAASAPGRPNVWSRSMEAKRVALTAATSDSGIAVLRTKDNQLQVNVPSDFSFDTDSAAIKPGMRPVLDGFAQDLEATALSHMLILVVGHTDDRGVDAVNDALSLARAESVRKYLVGKGIAAKRIAVQGRGEHQPLIDNDKSYGRALNRRVEIFLREPAM